MHCTQSPRLISFEGRCEKIKRNITVHVLLTAFVALVFTFMNIYQSFRSIALLKHLLITDQ